jgi:hypothetical protein
MLKFRPRAAAASEFANIPREFSNLPRDMQETINAMPAADREQVFAVLRKGQAPAEAARATAPSAASEAVQTARSISPVESIGPQLPRPTDPNFIGPRDFTGPRQLPSSGEPNFIGPLEQAGPRQLPRPTDPRFIGPREQIGPQVPRPGDPAFVGPLAHFGPPAPASSSRAIPVGTPYSGSYLPLFAGGTLAGTALLSGGQQTQDRMNSEADQQAAIEAARKMTDFDQSAPNTFNQQEAMRIASTRPEFNQSWSNQVPMRSVVPTRDTAPARTAPMPPTRPADLPREQPSILSRIFSGGDYQSNNELVNKPMGGAPVNWGNPESAADFFRADKALMAKRKEEEGLKRGGAANAKPDSLHKALEIIHHLLMTR